MTESSEERQRLVAYYSGEAFAHELEALDDAFLRAPSQETAPLAHAEYLVAHNYLAYLLHRRQMGSRMLTHLERLGDDGMQIPWAYLGYRSGAAALEDVRRQLNAPPPRH